MSSDEAECRVAKDVVATLESKGIKLLALDFDKTIVTVHTAGFWKQGTPKLAENVRPCFKALIHAAIESNLFVCVVTYSTQPLLIRDVLKAVLPKCDTTKVIIRANSKEWLQEQSVSNAATPLGKQQHIAWIVTELFNKKHAMIRPEEILLLDDDSENIDIAQRFGHMAYEVPDDVDLAQIRDFVDKLHVTRPPAATPTENVNPISGFAEAATAR